MNEFISFLYTTAFSRMYICFMGTPNYCEQRKKKYEKKSN